MVALYVDLAMVLITRLTHHWSQQTIDYAFYFEVSLCILNLVIGCGITILQKCT